MSGFVALFIPGLLLGGSSTFLLLGLWDIPAAVYISREGAREGMF